MNIIDKWALKRIEKYHINEKIKEEMNYAAKSQMVGTTRGLSIGPPSIEASGIQFTVHKASGGYVVETRTYNQRNDSHDRKLHIINDETDLGNAIGKIITMECLRG